MVPPGFAEEAEVESGYYIHLGRHEDQVETTSLQAVGDTTSIYNDGRYYYSTVASPIHATPIRFDTLVPSWNATTPRGTWTRLEVRVRSGAAWSGWLDLGVWASGATDVMRHSAHAPSNDPEWKVEVDTVVSRHGARADAYGYRLTLVTSASTLSPTVRRVSIVVSDSARHGEPLGIAPLESTWGEDLPVPARSQMVYPGGGEAWCSPASLSMVMSYWANQTGDKALDQSVPGVAGGVYDHAYGGWGNWPFNTAYAAHHGLEATVGRFGSIEQVERWIDVGVPVVASVAWNNGTSGHQLTGAPLPWSDGHLLVIRGFTASGDVIVNDPAASDAAGVPRVYKRDEFSDAWLRNPNSSGGIVYLVHPPGWPRLHGIW